MKIVIACDSFKGCLSAYEVCNAIKRGICSQNLPNKVDIIPMSDGGEGFLQCFYDNCGGGLINKTVSNPVFKAVDASYLSLPRKTAVIETASASGIMLLDKNELNPLKASTFGTGELIASAVKNGAEHIILGLGGSAANDGGMGALSAMGVNFFDIKGKLLKPCGLSMQSVSRIEATEKFKQFKSIEITLACDVENAYHGKNGAAYVFAPQKGADGNMVKKLDWGLENLACVFKKYNGIDLQTVKGAGAAGGLCGGLYAMLRCKIESGFSALCRLVSFDEKIKNADLIITGEGKTDSQTFYGKLPKMIAQKAKEHNIDCMLISGDIEKNTDTKALGFQRAYKIRTDEMPLEYAIKNAAILLERVAAESVIIK